MTSQTNLHPSCRSYRLHQPRNGNIANVQSFEKQQRPNLVKNNNSNNNNSNINNNNEIPIVVLNSRDDEIIVIEREGGERYEAPINMSPPPPNNNNNSNSNRRIPLHLIVKENPDSKNANAMLDYLQDFPKKLTIPPLDWQKEKDNEKQSCPEIVTTTKTTKTNTTTMKSNFWRDLVDKVFNGPIEDDTAPSSMHSSCNGSICTPLSSSSSCHGGRGDENSGISVKEIISIDDKAKDRWTERVIQKKNHRQSIMTKDNDMINYKNNNNDQQTQQQQQQQRYQQQRRRWQEEEESRHLLVRPNIAVDPVWKDLCANAKQSHHMLMNKNRNNRINSLFSMIPSITKNQKENRNRKKVLERQDSDILQTCMSTEDKVLLMVNLSINDKDSLPGYVYRSLLYEFEKRCQIRIKIKEEQVCYDEFERLVQDNIQRRFKQEYRKRCHERFLMQKQVKAMKQQQQQQYRPHNEDDQHRQENDNNNKSNNSNNTDNRINNSNNNSNNNNISNSNIDDDDDDDDNNNDNTNDDNKSSNNNNTTACTTKAMVIDYDMVEWDQWLKLQHEEQTLKLRECRRDVHGIIKHVTATLLNVRTGFSSSNDVIEMTTCVVEGLVIAELYTYVFDEIKSETKSIDDELTDKIVDFEMRERQFKSLCTNAIEELQIMPKEHSITGKLRQCVLFIDLLSSHFAKLLEDAQRQQQQQQQQQQGTCSTPCTSNLITADSLLPMVCQHIIAAKVPNIHGEMEFLEEFVRSEHLLRGKEGYVLVTIQAALHYLNTTDDFTTLSTI